MPPLVAWCSWWPGHIACSLNVPRLGMHLLPGPGSKPVAASQSRRIGLKQGRLSFIFLGGYSVNFLLGFGRGFPHSVSAPDTLSTTGTAKLEGPRERAAYTVALTSCTAFSRSGPHSEPTTLRRFGKRLGVVLSNVGSCLQDPKKVQRTWKDRGGTEE